MKVVVDTNVLMSGIFFSSPPARILKAWRDDELQLVVCPEIIDEYNRVAEALAQEYAGLDVSFVLPLIATKSVEVQAVPFHSQVCEDPDDDKFIACALCSDTRTIISGDKHLLKLTGFRGLEIVTPRKFVDTYLKQV